MALGALLIAIPAFADFPSAGIDGFDSDMNLVIDVTGVGQATTMLQGPVAVNRSDPRDDEATRVVDTEIVAMKMTGQFLGFDVELRINPEMSSIGEIRANGATSDFPADSFFDVFFEVDIDGVGTLVNLDPFRVEAAGLKAIPPLFDTYTHPPPQIPLVMKGTTGPVVATVQGESSHGPVQRPTFSIAAGGSLEPATGYGLPQPPPIVLSRTGLGLAAGDDIDGLSFGNDPIDAVENATLAFSVDPAAAGKTNTGVEQEAQNGEAEGAEFVTYVDGTNLLLVPADILVPVVGDPGDDLDAITDFPASQVDSDDDQVPNDPVFLSLAPGSPTLTALSASPADVIATQNGTASVFATAADMGLMTGDDIDAMCLMKSGLPLAVLRPGSGSPQTPPPGPQTFDYMLYSLADGSPTLTAQGHSPGDIFITDFSNNRPNLVSQPIEVYAEATDLGLLDGDELNALKCLPTVFAVEISGDGDLDPDNDGSGCEGGGAEDPIDVAFAMDMGLVYGDADFNQPPAICTGFAAPCGFGFYDFWSVQNPAASDYHGPYAWPNGPGQGFMPTGDPATLFWVGGPGDNCGLPHIHGTYDDPYLFFGGFPPHEDPDALACGHGVFVPSAFPILTIPTRRDQVPVLTQQLVDLLNAISGGLFSASWHNFDGPSVLPINECTNPLARRTYLLIAGIAITQFNLLPFGPYTGPNLGEQSAVAPPPGIAPSPIRIGPPQRVLPLPLVQAPEPSSGLLGAGAIAVLGALSRLRGRARGTKRPQ